MHIMDKITDREKDTAKEVSFSQFITEQALFSHSDAAELTEAVSNICAPKRPADADKALYVFFA